MTYDQILTLDTIVKAGSFKAAAEALFKSQPSLSMAIKKLEEEFGFEIFDRSGYRPVLTPQGEQFYQKAKKSLNSFQELENLGKEMGAGYETEIKICTDAIFPICEIAEILGQFFLPHISTTLSLNTDVLEGVIDQILTHKVDFALGSDISQNTEIEKVQISEVQVIPVIGSKHLPPDISLESLKKLPLIVVSSSVKEGTIREALSDQLWFTTDFSMKEQLIKAGLGWGRMPRHMVEESLQCGSLHEINLIPPIQAPMYLMRSKSKIMGPNTRKLWEFLKKQAR